MHVHRSTPPLLTLLLPGLLVGCGARAGDTEGAASTDVSTMDATTGASTSASDDGATLGTSGDDTRGDSTDDSSATTSETTAPATTEATTDDPSATTGTDPEPGPLTVHPTNPRYFHDGVGPAIVLVGVNHGWELQDDAWTSDYTLDFDGFLDYLEGHHHNFIRLWRVEAAKQTADDALLAGPMPYLRTGPGVANDGQPRFDLDQLDPAYFQRLHERCAAAADRGVYVDIMLFERHSTFDHKGPAWPWRGHPFHADNNVNGVDADVNADGQGREYFLLPEEGGDADVLARQEAFVRAAIDAVADLDNALFEICNECKPEANAWQAHMIAVARAHMRAIGRVYPVGFTGPGKDDNNQFPDFQVQLQSAADFVSPRDDAAYRTDPPANDGAKVIFADSDHIDPYGRDELWVWKSFVRGLHPQALEAYDVLPPDPPAIDPDRDARVRQSLGACLEVAERVDLAATAPAGDLCSSGYCLVDMSLGAPAIVLAPDGGPVELDLTAAAGALAVEWFELATGAWTKGADVEGGGPVTLIPPFEGPAAALVGAE